MKLLVNYSKPQTTKLTTMLRLTACANLYSLQRENYGLLLHRITEC